MARQLFFALLIFATLATSSVFSQENQPAEEPENQSQDTEQPVDPIVASVNLSSPRDTLTTFLTAMNSIEGGSTEYWPAALACIYLDEIDDPVVRAETGERVANQLYGILNVLTIDMERIQSETEGDTYSPTLGENEDVEIDFKHNDDGYWRFSLSKFEEQSTDIVAKTDQLEAEKVEEAELSADVNPAIANPRITMQTFIESMNNFDDGGEDTFLDTMDVSGIPELVRADTGEDLAWKLKQILDRHKKVIYQGIKDDRAGQPYLHLRENRLKIEIVPIPLPDNPEAFEWKFSKKTLDDINELWQIYINRPLVADVVDTSSEHWTLRFRTWLFQNYPFLFNKIVILENWQWLGMFISILLGMVISRVAAMVAVQVIRRNFNQEHLKLDEKLEKDFVRPVKVAIMAWVWWVALKPLGLPPDILPWLKTIIVTISSSAFVWAVYRLVDIFGNFIAEKARTSENKYDDMVVPMIVRALKIFVIVAGVIFVAQMNQWDYKTALAGVGIGGLAFALAAQDTLGNVFGSLTVLMDRPFQIGDWVQIGDVDGNIEAVGVRSTKVRTFYNSLITVPNSQLTNAVIDNYGARRYRRVKMNIGINYDTPPEKVEAFCEGIRELIRQHPYTRTDYYHVYLNAFDDSALSILLYCFHECPDWSTELRERHRLLLDIMRLAEKLDVKFAFPTQTLQFEQPAESNGQDRIEISSDMALMEGRKMAAGIVEEFHGKGTAKPPPVSFSRPSSMEAFQNKGGEAEE